MAKTTDKWISRDNETDASETVNVRYDECQKIFNATRNWEIEFDIFFGSHRKLEIFYEDLVNDR